MNANTGTEADRHARERAAERAEVLPGVGPAKALFMLAAGLSFLLSISFYFSGDHERGIFVGIWVPSILSMGTLLLGGNGHD